MKSFVLTELNKNHLPDNSNFPFSLIERNG